MKTKTMTRMLVLVAIVGAPALAATYKGTPKPKSDAELAKQCDLILGLDGAAYPPYKPSVIEWVQQDLETLGMYDGKADGRLDQPTMKAIAEFQNENDLHASGIPSPLTRKALRQDESVANKTSGTAKNATPSGSSTTGS